MESRCDVDRRDLKRKQRDEKALAKIGKSLEGLIAGEGDGGEADYDYGGERKEKKKPKNKVVKF